MRQTFAIALLQFRLVLKNKGTLLAMFGLPLLFTAVFGGLVGSDSGGNAGRTYPVAVVDQDGGFAAQQLTAGLQQQPTLKVRLAPADQVTKLLADRRISAGVIIPAGFQKSIEDGAAPEIQLMTAPGGNLGVAIGPVVRREVSRVAQDYRLARQATANTADAAQLTAAYAKVAADRQAMSVQVHQEAVQHPGLKQTPFSVSGSAVGFTVLFVMMIVFMLTGVILQERQHGTWGRLLTAPVTRANLLTGYLLSFFVTGMFQFAVLVGTSSLLFRVRWGPLLPLTAMAAAFVLCSAGLGLFVAGIVRTAEQQATLGILLVSSTSMLGGVYWPLELVGDTMRHIGYLTPQAWAMDGFREVMLRGGSWSGLAHPLAVLLSLTVIFMTAGLFRVRYE